MTKERDQHVTVCPRCGADAEWSFVDPEKQGVEIACPDCGRYRMGRAEFDQAQTESAEINEAEPR